MADEITSAPMKDGFYWFREAPGLQIHMVHVGLHGFGGDRRTVRDITGRMPVIRGPRYADELKGIWARIKEPKSPAPV